VAALKVLVVGGGAREHTLVWKLAQSDKVSSIYAAPGNAGTAALAQNLDISPSDINALSQAAKLQKIDLAVIGPEAPLSAGIVDAFQRTGIPTFGPTGEATIIESSKVFAKKLMHKYNIPCGWDAVFSSFKQAQKFVKDQQPPLVIKADGLAAGKGVIVAQSTEEALKALHDIMEARIFGAAGDYVLIEECLNGKETSLLAFTDGTTVVPMVPARDYKRALDHDNGPNTGGMGGYSPPELFDQALADKVIGTILEPTMRAMNQENKPYKGVLYTGLMLTADGPKVLEFNARFGDPETQVQLPLLQTDIVDIMLAVTNGTLDQTAIKWSNNACIGVVMSSEGYPGIYKTGFPITGLDKVDPDILIFHAGTKTEDGRIYTAGGRVLTVVATGETISEAREKVYHNITRIRFEGCYYRKDIGRSEG